MKPLPITVCMMCLNESERMSSALRHRSDFAEWIVLDTGSTDGTACLAESHGAAVRSIRWAGFSETRRRHFEMATQPWILWLDADERVTPELVAELRGLFAAEGGPEHCGYRINRVMQFEGRWIRYGDWYPDRVLRLFRADAWRMERREVHESVAVAGTTGRLVAELPHFSYAGWWDRSERIARYAGLWARQEAAKGRISSLTTASLRAGWRFFRCYLLKGGVRGGVMGVRISASCAKETWLKYAALAPEGRILPLPQHHRA